MKWSFLGVLLQGQVHSLHSALGHSLRHLSHKAYSSAGVAVFIPGLPSTRKVWRGLLRSCSSSAGWRSSAHAASCSLAVLVLEQERSAPASLTPSLQNKLRGRLTLLMAFCPWGAHRLHISPFRKGDEEGITWPQTTAGLRGEPSRGMPTLSHLQARSMAGTQGPGALCRPG